MSFAVLSALIDSTFHKIGPVTYPEMPSDMELKEVIEVMLDLLGPEAQELVYIVDHLDPNNRQKRAEVDLIAVGYGNWKDPYNWGFFEEWDYEVYGPNPYIL